MRLSRDILKEEILQNKIITNYADLDGQITANGFDCRLAALVEIQKGGRLAINKEDNIVPKLGKAWVLKGFENRIQNYKVDRTIIVDPIACPAFIPLRTLQPWFAITCEEVNIPSNMMIDINARSSLFRLTQSGLLCTFGEASYKGYLTFIIIPFIDSEIQLGVRFSQISFSELKGKANYENQLQNSYQGGKLF